jgi:hypothetical protein
MTAEPLLGIDLDSVPPALPERLAQARMALEARQMRRSTTPRRAPHPWQLTLPVAVVSGGGTILVAWAASMVSVPLAVCYLGLALLLAGVAVSRSERRLR